MKVEACRFDIRKIGEHTLFFCSLLCMSLLSVSCGEQTREKVTVDFNQRDGVNASTDSTLRGPALRVAVASMISPRETFSSYQELMEYLSRGIGLPTEFKQRKSYAETNQLLAQGQVDVAFICSGAYISAKAAGEIELLAVPLSRGRPYYRAYIITHKQSGIQSFEDFRGRSFAFTDPLSHTGYAYALMRLREIGASTNDYFSDSFFTYAHDNSILLVDKQLVHGATIDGLIYDYYARFEPDRVRNVKILERSVEYGIPPVIIPTNTAESMKRRLRDILFSMHESEEGKAILDKLLIDRFVEGRDSDYDGIRDVRRLIGK